MFFKRIVKILSIKKKAFLLSICSLNLQKIKKIIENTVALANLTSK